MRKKMPKTKTALDEMRPDYDLHGGVRGKFFAEYQEGTNVFLLDPDVAKAAKAVKRSKNR